MDITENELLSELTRELSLPPLAPGDVTVAMLVEAAGVSESTAARCLERKTAAGELEAYDAIGPNGRRVRAYRRKA
jgi:hypothetical protein